MRFLTLLSAISALFPVILSGPVTLPVGVEIEVYSGEKTGKHIVTLKEGASKGPIVSRVNELLAGKAGKGITDQFTIINGFAGNFDAITLAALQVFPGVNSIVEDGIAHVTGVQSSAPWGLARLSSKVPLANASPYSYYFDPRGGDGVDIYIIDTGIRITHHDFGRRAKWGASFGVANSVLKMDGNGHGTHCAGTAVGEQYGVAKKANVIAVKVMNDLGNGQISDIIRGLEYVKSSAEETKRPSVASMSLGGGASTALDKAVQKLVKAGVHVVVAAGNSDADAGTGSPARVAEVITVGATDITDARASYSNYGDVVDIFAPGTNIKSAWKDSDTSTNTISGTSMATPHVAGLVAYLISLEGNITPAQMAEKIKGLALRNVESTPIGTTDLLAHNGY